MFKDAYFVIMLQLTLIGIVLIGGFFLIWKAISRIEENVDLLLIQKDNKCPLQKNEKDPLCKQNDECNNLKMMEADIIMQQLFNADIQQEHIVPGTHAPHDTQIEEVSQPESSKCSEEVAPSEVSDSPMSRSKLRQMSLEKIKALCEEKDIAVDGTKNQLIDKLLAA